jgi:hypothetical protein
VLRTVDVERERDGGVGGGVWGGSEGESVCKWEVGGDNLHRGVQTLPRMMVLLQLIGA